MPGKRERNIFVFDEAGTLIDELKTSDCLAKYGVTEKNIVNLISRGNLFEGHYFSRIRDFKPGNNGHNLIARINSSSGTRLRKSLNIQNPIKDEMHLSIDVVRQPDPLKKITWTFVLYGSTFVLSEYRDQYKLPPSVNWRNKKQYDRLLTENNSIECDQIEIPEDVEAEVLERFIGMLTVTKWKDYSKPKK